MEAYRLRAFLGRLLSGLLALALVLTFRLLEFLGRRKSELSLFGAKLFQIKTQIGKTLRQARRLSGQTFQQLKHQAGRVLTIVKRQIGQK